jgi:DNA repair protein RadC
MQVYEMTAQYHLVRLGSEEPLTTPEKIVEYMQGAFADAPMVESVWVISLNARLRPLARTKISSGTLTASLVHPREVFRAALLTSAAQIVLVHNHPSGNPEPSYADDRITRVIIDAAKVMQIDLVDHVVIGTKEDDPTGLGYFSFREAGKI